MNADKQTIPSSENTPSTSGTTSQTSRRKWLWLGGLGAVLLVGLLVAATVYLLSPSAPTARVRDVFIILLALEGMVIGVALLVLVLQLAVLINLLQQEVKPILDSTTKTVRVLEGTAAFISDHLAEPIIKLNETTAALSTVLGALSLVRGRKKKPKRKGE